MIGIEPARVKLSKKRKNRFITKNTCYTYSITCFSMTENDEKSTGQFDYVVICIFIYLFVIGIQSVRRGATNALSFINFVI